MRMADRVFTIHCVVGTRPNFMKIAPLLKAFDAFPQVRKKLIHTGQHFDKQMSDVFFDELGIPAPDVNLSVPAGSAMQQMASMLQSLETLFLAERPDLVVVVGDVNSTLAAALAANRCGCRVAHVEAGLRSNDRTMPEEINRILVDHLADMHFVTEEAGMTNLANEGIRNAHLVGNVMIDTLVANREKFNDTKVLAALGLHDKDYVVLTLHRPNNVDTREGLLRIAAILRKVASQKTILWPIHPRTKNNIERFGLGADFKHENILSVEPLGYLEFMQTVTHSFAVLTDSGGIQEETTYLGIPCLTMRENTERPSTILFGTNSLVGLDEQKILGRLRSRPAAARIPPLWDGKAAERIAEIIVKRLSRGG
jgi:UDP-N-acetylglucosamine 2-epimerase (non-hydrolysing)